METERHGTHREQVGEGMMMYVGGGEGMRKRGLVVARSFRESSETLCLCIPDAELLKPTVQQLLTWTLESV